mgnify:CR=1 FL=1
MRTIDCLICGESSHTVIDNEGRNGLKITNVSCNGCGFVFTNPQLDEDENKAFYELLYRAFFHGSDDSKDISSYIKNQLIKGEKIYKNLENYGLWKNKDLKIFDIGCSAGGILKFFKERGFQNLHGIEPHKKLSKYAQTELRLNVKQGFIEDIEIDKYDLIIMRDVLEHLLDPNKGLKIVKELCHKDTVLYIDTNNLWVPLHAWKKYNYHFHYAHPYTFSVISLSNLLNKNGFSFQLIDGGRNIIGIAKVSDENNKYTLQKEAAENIRKFIKKHDLIYPIIKIRRKIRKKIPL